MNNKKQPTNQSENTLTEIFKYEVKEVEEKEERAMVDAFKPIWEMKVEKNMKNN